MAALLLYAAPRLDHTTWRGVLMFAPDAGYLLLGTAAFAVAWAAARAAVLLRRRA